MRTAALTLLAVALAASVATAQKPVKGGMGMTVGVTGITGGTGIGVSYTQPSFTSTAIWKYLITDNIEARLAVNFATTKSEWNSPTDTSVAGGDTGTYVLTGKGTFIAIAPGVAYHFAGTDRLDPYAGLQILYGSGTIGGLTSTEATTKVTDATPSGGNANGDQQVIKTDFGKTSTIGVSLFTGFNYYVTDMLAVGGEFGWGMANSSTKEGTTTTTVSGPGSAFGTDGTTTAKTGTSKNGGLGVQGTGTITLSVFFK